MGIYVFKVGAASKLNTHYESLSSSKQLKNFTLLTHAEIRCTKNTRVEKDSLICGI
jgi:hypothetical protein